MFELRAERAQSRGKVLCIGEHIRRRGYPDRDGWNLRRLPPQSWKDDAGGLFIARHGQGQHIAPNEAKRYRLAWLAGRHVAHGILTAPLVRPRVVRQPVPLKAPLYREIIVSVPESRGDRVQIGAVVEARLFDEFLVIRLFGALRTSQ